MCNDNHNWVELSNPSLAHQYNQLQEPSYNISSILWLYLRSEVWNFERILHRIEGSFGISCILTSLGPASIILYIHPQHIQHCNVLINNYLQQKIAMLLLDFHVPQAHSSAFITCFLPIKHRSAPGPNPRMADINK